MFRSLSSCGVYLLLAVVVFAAPKATVKGPDKVDFGRYSASLSKIAEYRIANTGDAELKITRVWKGCQCASAKSDKELLKPGEEARVEIEILADSISGFYEKYAFVEMDDPANRFQRLTVTGTAVPLVQVVPERIYFGRIPTNQPWQKTIAFKPSGNAVQLDMPLIESNYPVESSWQPGTNGGVSTMTVSGIPATNSGELACSITVPIVKPTNVPPVQARIGGKIGLELAMVPSIITLPVSDTAEVRTFKMRLLGEVKRLDPSEVKVSGAQGVAVKCIPDNDGRSVSAAVTFSPEFTKQLQADDTAELIFSVPGAGSAVLTCRSKRRQGG